MRYRTKGGFVTVLRRDVERCLVLVRRGRHEFWVTERLLAKWTDPYRRLD